MRIWLLALGLLAMQSAVCSEGSSRRLRALDHREKAYWKEFDDRFREAATAWYEPVRVQKHSGDNEPVRDSAKLRALFRELVDIEEARVANVRKARRFVEEHKVAFVHDIDVGLTKALEGADHDTVVVFGNGEITGGRFCLPELLLASFRRRNRFRRLVVHCVRVCNMGPDAERLLKELAASSGGTYVWNKAPPS